MAKQRIFALLMAGVLVLSGCGSKKADAPDAEPQQQQQQQQTDDPVKAEINDFFSKYVNTKERPIAIMVDNDDDSARPHAGLNEAYLIYEMIIEGGSTRFMALYRGTDTEKIGPVRSSRHYYLDYVLENDAIYTHFGWSPKAMSDIPALGINNINGVQGSDGNVFWRERKHANDWHSAYTSIKNIKDMASQKGYEAETGHANSLNFADEYITPETDKTAAEVSLKYSGKYTTGYKYNPEKAIYEKTINNAPHTMQNGDVLEVKNIIVELITDTALGDGSARRNINTAGEGKGYYITNGVCQEITWSKGSRSENTKYKTADGKDLIVNPGKTIVNIINPTAEITIQ